MEYRLLGRSGLKVSVISLGGWLTYGGHVEKQKTFDCMKAAFDAGVNFFDTAESYAGGQSEVVMGECIRKYGWARNELVISTKINWGGAFASKGHAENSVGLSRKHIVEGLSASLGRLGLDYVDLVYAHRPDRLTPMEETVRAFNHVIDQGKAFYWGTSEWSAEEITDAWRVADRLGLIGPVMEQPQYNLLVRDRVEREFYNLYAKHGLGLTTFSPLKMGILSGKYNDFKIPEGSRLSSSSDAFTKSMRAKFDTDEEMKKQINTTKRLEAVAKELGITLSQLAIAWIIKNPNISSVITGASRPEQVLENVEAVKHADKLTPEIMERVEEIVDNKPQLESRRFA
ncbi:Aldo/keto reductase [Tuber magnatum]|uniref:Aldo/keto reductase n=1 Tax=Tuber magnatum TaxID=42249 RepID=A0A317SKL1_9PEZI|nr:Aldo/keto reductase [Tuber magnatum]